jgi:putative restriction endonuclease
MLEGRRVAERRNGLSDMDHDTAMRLAAFAHIRQLLELRDALTANDLKPGFQFEGVRIPLINPQRGIFKPTQMKYLLSIKTVFPKPGGRVFVRRSAGSAWSDFRGRGYD